jgi:glycerophosphoryl diester phosphodiesterase
VPENTLAAFVRAFADGADGIELDVRLAMDGVPVVVHDATLRRTGLTNQAVAEMTSKQLAKVDVGTWFNRKHAQLARDEYADERLPTLQNALGSCRNQSGIVYIELKSDANGSKIDLVRSVAGLINKLEFHARVVVVSFDLEALAAMKALDGSIRAGALFAPTRNGTLRSETIVKSAVNGGADEILLHRLLARTKMIEKARQHNLPVVLWTVDDPKWIQRADTLGIQALITNDPGKLLDARQEYAERPR